jgi:hypothetical protein
LQISPGVGQLLQSFGQLVQHPSSVFKMAEIARTLGEKRMCRMEVDYLGLEMLDIFCVEHELVLQSLTSIQSMVSEVVRLQYNVGLLLLYLKVLLIRYPHTF